jgi:pimeloyl-ACP methyl ester carboxylesterase
MTPERDVRYVDSGGLQIAYETVGRGPLDIVLLFEWGTSLDLAWDDPRFVRFVSQLAELGRVIRFDMRGIGLSDRVDVLPPLEEWAEDIQAVLSAVGSERAALVGHGHAAQPCMLFAAMHPERVTALVTINGFARLRRAADYPWGLPPRAEASTGERMRTTWGTGHVLGSFNPSLVEGPRGLERTARAERAAATPRVAALKQASVFEIDVRDVLPAIAAPTLVIHTRGNSFILSKHGEYLAEMIPDATYVELPGGDHSPFFSDDAEQTQGAIDSFLTGNRRPVATQRSLMTVAFTDIVDSTTMAAELGDRRWRSLLETHEAFARREVGDANGRIVKFTGDGLMATFEGPARAVQCMKSLGEVLESVGLPIRAGVHTGEVEAIGDDIGGIAVHIAARISAKGGAGEILTSSTVRDLVAGSGLEFEDRGEHELKGVPGAWRVLAVR